MSLPCPHKHQALFTCFANSMSPVYAVWAAKLCSFVNKHVEFQEWFAQVFSYLFLVLLHFLFFSFLFFCPSLTIPKQKSKPQACGPFSIVLVSTSKAFSTFSRLCWGACLREVAAFKILVRERWWMALLQAALSRSGRAWEGQGFWEVVSTW